MAVLNVRSLRVQNIQMRGYPCNFSKKKYSRRNNIHSNNGGAKIQIRKWNYLMRFHLCSCMLFVNVRIIRLLYIRVIGFCRWQDLFLSKINMRLVQFSRDPIYLGVHREGVSQRGFQPLTHVGLASPFPFSFPHLLPPP